MLCDQGVETRIELSTMLFASKKIQPLQASALTLKLVPATECLNSVVADRALPCTFCHAGTGVACMTESFNSCKGKGGFNLYVNLMVTNVNPVRAIMPGLS